MEKKNNTNQSSTPDSEKVWYQSIWFITLCIVLFVVAGYLGFSRMNESKKVFTQYEPIGKDSMETIEKILIEDNLSDSLDTSVDSLDKSEETELVVENTNSDTEEESIFKVNTSYDKIVTEPANDALGESAKPSILQGGLFEELLLPEDADQAFKNLFGQYAQEKVVSAKSVLKLLSIASKPILLGNNTVEDVAILEAITESENIVGILIADRKGRVVYATNRKYIDGVVVDFFPRIDIVGEKLFWYKEENQSFAALPVYHTYGRIGMAVLITE